MGGGAGLALITGLLRGLCASGCTTGDEQQDREQGDIQTLQTLHFCIILRLRRLIHPAKHIHKRVVVWGQVAFRCAPRIILGGTSA